MTTRRRRNIGAGIALALSTITLSPRDRARAAQSEATAIAGIVRDASAGFPERLAAREIRRYFWLRTGRLLAIRDRLEALPREGSPVIVGTLDRAAVSAFLVPRGAGELGLPAAPGSWRLRSVPYGSTTAILVVGRDPAGVLYGAYRFAERLGVRFALHGDIVGRRSRPISIGRLDVAGEPLFALRGIQPFHDFPEGPDLWSTDGYKAILAQLPKLGMNFFGLHTYPEGNVGPEPTVWIGPPEDLGPDGTVRASYPARHFTTRNGTWGYRPTSTADYLFGARELFAEDVAASPPMRGAAPWPASPAAENELFRRTGGLLAEAFGFARRLGIRTCLGTETPLTIPEPVAERIRSRGGDPSDPAVVGRVYEAMFQRIMATHPLDWYWFWTPENWTWRGAKPEQVEATLQDLRAALAAARRVKAPFGIATCGWVLGPPSNRSLFDEELPPEVALSCINRAVGHDPVEPGFARVEGRGQWAIPWLEDDPALVSPQLWVGRMRRDAADALAFGCDGLLGIHWRTRAIEPNVVALARAAWGQSGWNHSLDGGPPLAPAEKERSLASGDFYQEWARTRFGPEAAGEIAAIFTRIDGRLPRPSDWVQGPGGIRPDRRSWSEVAPEYSFVDDLAALRPRIEGAGERERFDYWLATFRYLRATARLRVAWGKLEGVLAPAEKEKAADRRGQIARESALPAYREVLERARELHDQLLGTVTTTGALGTVINWQQHDFPMVLGKSARRIEKLLGGPLPDSARPAGGYRGPARLVVPEKRTLLLAGEPLRVEAIVIGGEPAPGGVRLFWRPLGTGAYSSRPLGHAGRGVWRGELPSELARTDLEVYVEAELEGSVRLHHPPAAPEIAWTIVVLEP